jgi:glycosyltransferase involved in cell wall biosynthesis
MHPRKDEDLLDPDTYKIIYLGSIRKVNHVKELILAAELLKDNPKYRFFIYGDGNERPELEQYVKDNGISNVVFKEKHIPFEEVAWVVSQATVNVMNYQKNFGIHGVSSGKMFQYFAAGKPILCNIKLNYSEISRNNLGIDRELDTPEQYATAIRDLAEQPQADYDAMCVRVRETAKRFDYKILTQKELEVIER